MSTSTSSPAMRGHAAMPVSRSVMQGGRSRRRWQRLRALDAAETTTLREWLKGLWPSRLNAAAPHPRTSGRSARSRLVRPAGNPPPPIPAPRSTRCRRCRSARARRSPWRYQLCVPSGVCIIASTCPRNAVTPAPRNASIPIDSALLISAGRRLPMASSRIALAMDLHVVARHRRA